MVCFSFKFSWNMIKVAFFLVFLPFILVALVVGGLVYIAFPILVVAMIIGLLVKEV